jgi:hypothetical protein
MLPSFITTDLNSILQYLRGYIAFHITYLKGKYLQNVSLLVKIVIIESYGGCVCIVSKFVVMIVYNYDRSNKRV